MEKIETINPFTVIPWEKRVQTLTDEAATDKAEETWRLMLAKQNARAATEQGATPQEQAVKMQLTMLRVARSRANPNKGVLENGQKILQMS